MGSNGEVIDARKLEDFLNGSQACRENLGRGVDRLVVSLNGGAEREELVLIHETAN